VAVGIERDRDRRVPKQVLHDLWVDALRQQMCGSGMPEVVDPHSRQSGTLERPVKADAKVGHIPFAANRIREDKVTLLPLIAGVFTVFGQRTPMLIEHRHRFRRKRHRSPTSGCLWFDEGEGDTPLPVRFNKYVELIDEPVSER